MAEVIPIDRPKGPRLTLKGGAAMADPVPPVPWVCEPIELAPGPPTIFAGRGYSGKTVAAQAALLAVAAGQNIWGAYSVTTGPVVHVDYEQGERLTFERYQRLARAMDVDLRELGDRIQCATYPDLYLDQPKGLTALEHACIERRLCLVDSLKAALPAADENKSDIRRHIDPLARISERTGCCIVLLHHARKSREEDSAGAEQTIRGSSAIFDACQSVLVFEGQKGKTASTVRPVKARLTGRNIKPFDIVISDVEHGEDERGGLLVRVAAAVRGPTAFDRVKERIVSELTGVEGLNWRGLFARVRGGKAVFDQALEEMVEAKQVLVQDGARGAHIYRLASTVTTSDEWDEGWEEP